MKNFLSSVANFIREEEGATAVEYGVLVALIAGAIIIVVTAVGNKLETVFNNICVKLGNGTC